MASLHQQQFIHRDRVCFGSMFRTQTRPRGSKSQMCLHRILRIITTVPPLPPTSSPQILVSETKESTAENDSNDENQGPGFDLNVEFHVPSETGGFLEAADGSGLSSASSNDGGCREPEGWLPESTYLDNGGDRAEKEGSGSGVSENGRFQFKVEETGNSLTLLAEAATLIFGEFKENDESDMKPGVLNRSISRFLEKDGAADERQLRLRKTEAAMGEEFEEPPSSPVVRSKRGRTQILPRKYRDSVLEPLTRLPRNSSSSILQKKPRRR